MSHPNEVPLSELESLLKTETDPKKIHTLNVAIARRKAEAAPKEESK